MKRLIVPPARGVPALEDDDVFRPDVLAPVLELQQLDLEQVLLVLVLLALEQLVVGVLVAPGLDGTAVRAMSTGSSPLPP